MEISDEKLREYFEVTEEALDVARDNVNEERGSEAKRIIDMVGRYLSDARHFEESGDRVNAFAALNYAHGWLDTGAVLDIFDVNDNRLFTTD